MDRFVRPGSSAALALTPGYRRSVGEDEQVDDG
jgi:hypothetical protein